ncbi:MAG: hypothetical protein LBS69_10355 [Prevotellaceae bacterium]|nr:hypothetical protein [Prevotellaceae bacterium]
MMKLSEYYTKHEKYSVRNYRSVKIRNIHIHNARVAVDDMKRINYQLIISN